MPAYNEEENIKAVVLQWYEILDGKSDDSRLVVADSGSTDNTHVILQNLKREGLSKLEILENTDRQHGPKVIALYKYSIDQGADYVFQTDSDGQTNPEEFYAFWTLRKKYAGILGNRNVRGDGVWRAFVEKVVCALLRLYFGVRVPDANAPFRLLDTSVLKKYVARLPEDYNIPNIMITTYFAFYKETILFKTISFASRQGGVNSINILRIIKIGYRALGDFHSFKKQMKGKQ